LLCLDVEEEAQDLLEPSEARKLAKHASGVDDEIQKETKEPEFVLPINDQGKLVISDRTLKKAERKIGNQLKRSKELGSETEVTSKSNKRTKKSETRFSRGSRPTTKSHVSGNRYDFDPVDLIHMICVCDLGSKRRKVLVVMRKASHGLSRLRIGSLIVICLINVAGNKASRDAI